MNPEGNSALTIGPVDKCRQLDAVGETFAVDLIVDSVPSGLAGFDARIRFDTALLELVSVNNDMMLTAGGNSEIFDFSNTVADAFGEFSLAVADFGPNDESGDGVLSRFEFETIGEGSGFISYGSPVILAGTPDVYPVFESRPGIVTVGAPTCATLDTDGDGAPDITDSCLGTPNPLQIDTDGDGAGNDCDGDDDNDFFVDLNEVISFSNPLNAASTPEIGGVCGDGIDNDMDGSIDRLDGGCSGRSMIRPYNDNRSAAESVPAAPYNVPFSMLANSTLEPGELLPCGGVPGTIWFRLDGGAHGRSLEVTDSVRSRLAVYTVGAAGGLLLHSCENGAGTLELDLLPGQAAYIQLARADEVSALTSLTILNSGQVVAPVSPRPTLAPIPRVQ